MGLGLGYENGADDPLGHGEVEETLATLLAWWRS
jgi:hypothetical protein